MAIQKISNRGIFGLSTDSQERYIHNYKRLSEVVEACKTVGIKIVLTMGTFDLVHIGHFLYFEKARSQGDLLIVGVDSDKKVKARKGPSRPIVPEAERVQMLTHVRNVDIVTIKPYPAPKWELIKLVKPDILVATKDTYTKEEMKQLKRWCGQVVVLPPQATTSTTAKLRRLNLDLSNKMKVALNDALQKAFEDIQNHV